MNIKKIHQKRTIRIGLYLNNEGHKDIDLNSLQLGNPGIGGTDYWFYSLAYFLTKYHKDIKCFFFTTSKPKFSMPNVQKVQVSGVLEAITKSKENRVDVFIINKHANTDECDLKDICTLINKVRLSTVTVGHNFYSKKECDLIAGCKYIKRNVYVSKQQFSIYSDLDIHEKDTYIWNFIPMDTIPQRNRTLGKIVTYTGALTSTKGFHLLAKSWKKILKFCPEARLNVIGSGNLYSRNSILGSYGVADKSYEKIFMPYLLDKKGKIIKSVNFLGLLNANERQNVYRKTAVGVVNPSGISECCSITSIEFAANGIPVVSKRYGGLIDTVLNNKTGILVRDENELASAIINLLKDRDTNISYGNNALTFARSTFSPERNAASWHNLFIEIIDNKKPKKTETVLLRRIKKIIYAILVGRPRLIRKESLKMPFNNYERYTKPGLAESLTKVVRDLALFKLKLGRIYNQMLIIKYGKFKGVSAPSIATEEKLIFSEEKFKIAKQKDVFGKSHNDFLAYEETIPPLYVRTFKNAYCITNREEIISSNKDVISDYTSQEANPLIGENKRILEEGNIKKINGRVAHLSLSGLENNYYHFLTECLGRLYLIAKSKIKPDFYIISDNLSFQREWLNLLGIGKNKIISTNSNMIIQAKELVVADFINNWEYSNFRGHKYYQKRWIPGWITELYRGIVLKFRTKSPKRIYISRSRTDGRKIENETEVGQVFKKLGFGIYNLETMGVVEQLKLFANASFIAGIHGAGLVNMNFAPLSAKIFEIFPEFYHDASYRIQAKALGLRYYYMIGKTMKTGDVEPQHEKVYVNIKNLKKALNKITKRNAN